MNAKKNLIPLLFLLIMSCKKDKKTEAPEEIQNPVVSTPHTYRLIDSSDAHVQVNVFTSRWLPNTNLDVNGDQVPDLRINELYDHAASGYNFSDTKIETLNNSIFILCDSIYTNLYWDGCTTTSNVTTVNELFPRVLSYHDSLKVSAKWRNGNFHLTHYDEQWPIKTGPGTCNVYNKSQNWPDSQWRYIGIKINGRIGWLKMYSPLNKGARFYEYGLEL